MRKPGPPLFFLHLGDPTGEGIGQELLSVGASGFDGRFFAASQDRPIRGGVGQSQKFAASSQAGLDIDDFFGRYRKNQRVGGGIHASAPE
jgi:hypothetical protein